MDHLLAFYRNRITLQEVLLRKVRKQLWVSSILRLVVFLMAALSVYFLFGNTEWVVGIVILTVILFLFLVSKHTDLQYKRDKFLALIHINETEIQILQRRFHHLPDGAEFKDVNHVFAQDIDLFGKGSFYQYANRTALSQGSRMLAELLMENTTEHIVEKQSGIKELSQMPDWRQEFSAVASLVRADASANSIIKWLGAYTSFVPKAMRYIPNLFSLLSLGCVAGFLLGLLPGLPIIVVLIVGILITGFFFKNTSKLASDTNQLHNTFRQYQKLIFKIEEISFASDFLRIKREAMITQEQQASKILKEFSDILGALDQRNNMIVGLLGNGFLLWDLRQGYKLERWIAKHGSQVGQWFDTVAFFDAYNSFGNFAYNHPAYTFPKLIDDGIVLKSDQASHPLLDPQKAVPNDIHILREQFFIITGANMAGKSTFLRTVSLQIVMANVGLPVCATAVEYNPIKLITSMRTTDSLTDDESYFFSELKRLKFIVDQIKKDQYFIVLDEILKGTNSLDKASGSRKFVEKLIGSRSTGIIATHDLSLCEVSGDLPQVKNYYFDAEIVDDELYFDYTFKPGVCQNMNASFLLKKMGIVE
ncbi:MAG TPA: hypothetical protein VLZ54_05245 [Arenibacter sp.]|nr:hypothetical protein [Arenibacter sp.]